MLWFAIACIGLGQLPDSLPGLPLPTGKVEPQPAPPKVFLPGTETEPDPAFLEEVEELVIFGRMRHDDIWIQFVALEKNPDRAYAARELKRLRPEYDRRLDEQIQTRPGLKPYLFYLLEKKQFGRQILQALALRDDLTPEDVQIVSREVATQLANPITDPSRMGDRAMQFEYLSYAMDVLGRDLTPANQDLLLQALGRRQYADVKVKAAHVLAKAGVARAGSLMQAAIDQLVANGDPRAEYLRKDLALLKRKIAPKPGSGVTQPTVPNSVRPEPIDHHFSPE